MLELNNISKTYDKTIALVPLDLSVPTGKTTVLIGQSGCGKSTLLRIIMGLIQPDTGSVDFEGVPMTVKNTLTLRHKMGYVIQDGGLFPHLTAFKNVSLMARHLGWQEGRIKSRIKELADLTRFPFAGLERFPAQLSGGQRQRVSLMRALMLDPDLLLLDEPLAALDPMIRSGLQGELKHIFQSLGKTVVIVTHDMGEAVFFGDLIVLMRDGLIVQQGSFRQLVQEPADTFVTEFINAQRSPLDALAGE